MKRVIATAAFFLSANFLSAQPVQWKEISMPRFSIYYEARWAPSSIGMEVEKMFSTLGRETGIQVSSADAKTSIYIYASEKNYLAGEFKPPQWSKGIIDLNRRIIAVYYEKDMDALRAVIAHELTHLILESLFYREKREIPQWLNEGLAVKMEDAELGKSGGPWANALVNISTAAVKGFDNQFKVDLSTSLPQEQVTSWYLQSYAMVRFISGQDQNMRFKYLLNMLVSGTSLDDALWKAYRFRDRKDFESKFREWVFGPQRRERTASSSTGSSFTPFQFTEFKFSAATSTTTTTFRH